MFDTYGRALIQISDNLSPSDCHNICAVKLFGKKSSLIVTAAYRASKVAFKFRILVENYIYFMP